MKYKLHKKNAKHSNGDGYITGSGHTMFQQDIASDLNYLDGKVKELQADIIHTDKVHAGDVRELQAKVERLENGVNLAISSLTEHMHPNRGGEKCWGCMELAGHAHQSYCLAVEIVERLKNLAQCKDGNEEVEG